MLRAAERTRAQAKPKRSLEIVHCHVVRHGDGNVSGRVAYGIAGSDHVEAVLVLNRRPDPRAAVLARQLHEERVIELTTSQLERLTFACDEHTNGLVSNDPTIGACWDADRLDLPRVGVVPRADLFSTEAARECAGSRPAISWHELVARL